VRAKCLVSTLAILLMTIGLSTPAVSVAAEPKCLNSNAPQIGLNFIRFYWPESPRGGLDTSTPYRQPDWIFNDFADLGVHAYRQFVMADLLWDVVEPRDSEWNWQAADVVLRNPKFEPIVTLFSLQYSSPTPPWASSPAQFQKRIGAEARDYLETVVRRYASFVKYWELGNEMDHWRAADPNEKPLGKERLPSSYPVDGFSPYDQGIFLSEAAAIIRSLDPDAVIMMPGLGGLDDYCVNSWLSGVVEGGGSEWFDIVNYHYYSSWERYSLLRLQFQDALKRLGISDKPVWLTETGATTSPTLTIRTNYPNSPESQAADVFRRIVQAYGHDDSFVAWHTYIGSSDTTGDWRAYGIRTEKAEAQPAYFAFKLLTHELIPFERVEKISANAKGMNVYKITTREGAVKYVAWGNGLYTIPLGTTEMTTVIPRLDGSHSWQPAQPGEAISLSPNPILLK